MSFNLRPPCGCIFSVPPDTGVIRIIHRCHRHRSRTPRTHEAYTVEYYRELGVISSNPPHPAEFNLHFGELNSSDGGVAIEVGSGISPYVAMFRDKGYHYIAIDSSPQACDWMRINSGVTCYNVPIDSPGTPVQDEVADIVFSAHCLEHVGNLRQSMFNMVRMLKPGGLLYTLVPDWGNPFNSDHIHYFSQDSLISLMHKFDLSVTHCCTIKIVEIENFIYCIAHKSAPVD
jgi:SAM-dependent methyltransferase